jgi:hypothetical protein
MSLWRRRLEILGSLDSLRACQWLDVQVSWISSPDLNGVCPLRDIETPLSRSYEGMVVRPDQSKIRARCTKANEELSAIRERSCHFTDTDRSIVASPMDC